LPVAAAVKPLGRPPIYKKEYDELAERLCLLGMTDAEIAAAIGVSIQAMKIWDRDHPSFSAARAEGKEFADARVAKALHSRAIGYSHKATKFFLGPGGVIIKEDYIEHYPPDTHAAALWLANRRRKQWSLKPSEEPDKEGGGGITIKIEGGLPDD